MKSLGLTAFATVTLIGLCGCAARRPNASAGRAEPLADRAVQRPDVVFRYIGAALGRSPECCRLCYCGTYLAGKFPARGSFRFPEVMFPRIPARSPPRGETGVAALRAVFRGDKDVVVRKGRSGVIRVYIGRVSPDILDAKLRSLALTKTERYSAELSIDKIADSAAVEKAARRFGFRQSGGILDVIFSGPVPGTPHLPARIEGVTVDQALDKVAKTFGVIVCYGECRTPTGGRMYRIWCYSPHFREAKRRRD
jgi:hypothetical protein